MAWGWAERHRWSSSPTTSSRRPARAKSWESSSSFSITLWSTSRVPARFTTTSLPCSRPSCTIWRRKGSQLLNTAEPAASICTVWSSSVVTWRNGLKNELSGTPLAAWITNFSAIPTPTPTSRSVSRTAMMVATKMASCSGPIRNTLRNSLGEANRAPV